MWKRKASSRAERPLPTAWGIDEKNVLHGDHYEIDGLVPMKANARVCTASNADRFLQLFVSRIKGK